jgi:hypothetical protein
MSFRGCKALLFSLLLAFTFVPLAMLGQDSSSSAGTQPAVTCPSVTLAESVGPYTGVAPLPPAAPSPPPNPGTTSAGSVCVSSPANGATVSSPVHVKAAAKLVHPIYFIRVFADGKSQYFDWFNTVDAFLWLAPGPHKLEVLATDKTGKQASTTFTLNVTSTKPAPVSQIQTLPLWDGCSAKFPPGHPRAGQLCAAGSGNAISTITENQSSPSLTGHSAKFTMGGPTKYTNMLWTRYLGGGAAPTHFTYDLWFYVDRPEVTQALEFDTNQTFGGTRWVFGTECNLKGDHVWDVWDGVKGWIPTKVPCSSLPAKTWNHLVWTFQRVGTHVRYISVELNGTTFPLNLYYSNQANVPWRFEGIDVAFQMDGDYRQDPYNVWLDKVTLSAY